MSTTEAKVCAISLSELAGMSEATRSAKLGAITRAAARVPNGELRDLEDQISKFELRFGIDSRTLRQEIADGRRQETVDVCDWLMLLQVQERLRAKLVTRAG